MIETEGQAWQKVAKYQANVAFLHSILNLIAEAMLILNGQELEIRIAELIEEGKDATSVPEEVEKGERQ